MYFAKEKEYMYLYQLRSSNLLTNTIGEYSFLQVITIYP